jgi:GNAT superfamily N-acetyltransferase
MAALSPGDFSEPRPLRAGDSLEGFSCGVDLVDRWLHERARTARAAGTAVVYVSFCREHLAGFYTLSSHSVARDGVRGWLARNAPEQVPVILLGMLGVDRGYQGVHLGSNLLLDAVQRAGAVSSSIGARALVVDPADEASRAFYAHHGFRGIPQSQRMFAKLL